MGPYTFLVVKNCVIWCFPWQYVNMSILTETRVRHLVDTWSISWNPPYVFPCAVVEYCGVSSRTVPLLMVMMSYTLASLTLPWVAMLMPSWRFLSLTAALAILPILAGWKWVSALKRKNYEKTDVQVDSGVTQLVASKGSHQGGLGPIGAGRPVQQSWPPGSASFFSLSLFANNLYPSSYIWAWLLYSEGEWDSTGTWEGETDWCGQSSCQSHSSPNVQNWKSPTQRISLHRHLVNLFSSMLQLRASFEDKHWQSYTHVNFPSFSK